MPKVIKSSIQNNFKGCPTLRVFQYENSKKYYCMFYVGGSFGTRGTIIRPTKEHNRKFAITKAKEEYRNFFLNNKKEDIKKNTFDFTKDIALPYFETRHKQYKVRDKNLAYVKKDKNRYLNYIKNFLDGIDYREEELMNTAILDLVDDLKERKMRKTTISKYMNSLSLMCKYGQRKGKMKAIPDIPTFTRINEEVPPYFPQELKKISTEILNQYKQTEDSFYLEMNDFVNFLRSFGAVRPGLNPLMIKYSQCSLIKDNENPNDPVLQITLFNTKNKARKTGTVHNYWTQNHYFNLIKRHKHTLENYLFYPKEKNRPKLYEKIRKTFVRISSELNLYIFNGRPRPMYSIRHSVAKKRFKETGSLEVVADSINTSVPILKSNYLNEDEQFVLERHKKTYPELYSKKSKVRTKAE